MAAIVAATIGQIEAAFERKPRVGPDLAPADETAHPFSLGATAESFAFAR
jgi:hypothetical protein